VGLEVCVYSMYKCFYCFLNFIPIFRVYDGIGLCVFYLLDGCTWCKMTTRSLIEYDLSECLLYDWLCACSMSSRPVRVWHRPLYSIIVGLWWLRWLWRLIRWTKLQWVIIIPICLPTALAHQVLQSVLSISLCVCVCVCVCVRLFVWCFLIFYLHY